MKNLKKELEVLWRLQADSGGTSNQFIVQCLHNQLASSSSSSHTPIFTTPNSLSLSSPTSDPNQFSVPAHPMIGLVLECGGPNLQKFVLDNHSRLDAISRVQIMRDVVSALEFLHDHHIVHGDLKPENIVSFSCLGEGMVRWKLIDLEHSHYLRSNPAPLVSYGMGFTPEYSAPEMLRVLGEEGAARGESLLVSRRLDIWSLGMVSVYIMKGCTVWRLLGLDSSPAMVRQMVREWKDEDLNRLLRFFREKEKTFLESCLRDRLSCGELLDKSLFGTGNSTLQGSDLRVSAQMLEDLRNYFSQLMETSREAMTSEMSEALLDLAHLIQRQR